MIAIDRTFMSGLAALPSAFSDLPAFRMAHEVLGKAGNDGRKVGQVTEDAGVKFFRCLRDCLAALTFLIHPFIRTVHTDSSYGQCKENWSIHIMS